MDGLTTNPEITAEALLQAGQQALAQEDRQRAYHLWRRAAALTPQDPDVWWALLNVVEDDADRRACLENILRLEPDNAQAKRLLATYELMGGPLPQRRDTPTDLSPAVPQARPRLKQRSLLWFLGLILVSTIGVIMLVMMYAALLPLL